MYQDDLIIYSNTLEDHWAHVNLVLERLIMYSIKLKFSKCKIAQKRIEYLSHIIENGTIRPSPRKTDALFNVKSPTTVNQVHKMLGLAAFYKKFIRGFAEIVKPLREVIQECNLKNLKNLTWNKERQDTFEKSGIYLHQNPFCDNHKWTNHFKSKPTHPTMVAEASLHKKMKARGIQ